MFNDRVFHRNDAKVERQLAIRLLQALDRQGLLDVINQHDDG